MTVNSDAGFIGEKPWLPVSIAITQNQAMYLHTVSALLSVEYEPFHYNPNLHALLFHVDFEQIGNFDDFPRWLTWLLSPGSARNTKPL